MDECPAFRLVQDPSGTRRRLLLVEELVECTTSVGDTEVVDVVLKSPRTSPSHKYRLVPSAKMRFDSARQKSCVCGDGAARAEIHYFPAGLAASRRQEPSRYQFRTLTITQDGAAAPDSAE